MQEIFTRVWHNLVERTQGPLHFRVFIQPAMSLLFTVLAAVRDAKKGIVPYLWKLKLAKKEDRIAIKKELWRDVGKVFILGVALDVVYQLTVIYKTKTQETFYVLESFIVGFILAILPYLLLRGPVNRIVRTFIKKDKP